MPELPEVDVLVAPRAAAQGVELHGAAIVVAAQALGRRVRARLAAAARGAEREVVDLHQHTPYSGRTADQLVEHQRALGIGIVAAQTSHNFCRLFLLRRISRHLNPP